jgi:hypothetical protein
LKSAETIKVYEKPYIISGTVLPSSQKPTLSLLATITLEIVAFRAYAPFPCVSAIFLNASWKSCSVVKGNLSVLSSIRGTEKSRVGGDG